MSDVKQYLLRIAIHVCHQKLVIFFSNSRFQTKGQTLCTKQRLPTYEHGVTAHTSIYTRTPLTPLRSLSSMNNDRYSGDFVFRLMKYSKSDDIICLNSLSLLKDSCRKWSKRSFKSKRLCCHTQT